ncbi:Uncharacterised protein [Mycobacteroides abscessus subsp. abscessus]|nr:Uncharacterised protein [Mycobacteroides abscessus subsp. abscessus]
MVATASRPDSRLAVHHNHAKAPTPSTTPKIRALRVVTEDMASGRRAVRFITLSISASATQFRVLALAAAMTPPSSVFRMSSGFTSPRSANSIAGMVVTSSSSMTRGLVSAMYARMVRRKGGAFRPRPCAPCVSRIRTALILLGSFLVSQPTRGTERSTTDDGRPPGSGVDNQGRPIEVNTGCLSLDYHIARTA